MNRTAINPMPEYFDRYITMTEGADHLEVLETGLREMEQFPLDTFRALGVKVYAPGKWTVKLLLQHLIDTERIFTYRALAFARKEAATVLSYDEDSYAANSDAESRTLESIVEEMITVRRSTIALFRSFSDEALLRSGKGFRGEYSVLSIAFILAGHPRWHMKIIRERYLPLLNP